MEALKLTTENRTETGKSAARRARAAGLVPGVFYGPTTKPRSLAVAPKALTQALSTAFKRNILIQLDVDGETRYAMVKELQVHPVTREVRHVDFYEVSLERPVQTLVPFAVEGRAKGVIAGGELNVIFRDLPIRATPDKIPALIKVDVTNMALGDYFQSKQLELPEGVEVTLDGERNLISCLEPRKRPTEEEGTPGKPGEAAASA